MADISFTNLTNLPPDIATNLENINRKRRIQDALMAQTMQPHQTQMGRSGRYQVAVPYSPLEGATKLIQAAMLSKASDRNNQALTDLGQRFKQDEATAVEDVLFQARGRPESRVPNYNESPQVSSAYNMGTGPIVPGVKPDPMGAITTGAGSPYQGAQRVSDAMLSMKRGDRGAYYTPIYGEDGRVWKWDNRTGKYAPTEIVAGKFDPTTQGNIAFKKGEGKVLGEDTGQAQVDLPMAEEASTETTRLTDKLRTHPGMKDVIGFPDNPFVMKGNIIPGTDAADFKILLDQITGRTFMEIFPTLKGGGQITEVEGEKGQASINRMKTASSEKAFLEAVDDFDAEIIRLKEIVRKRAGVPPAPNNGNDLFNEADRILGL